MIPVIDPGSAIGALRRVRELLEEEFERYICLALNEVMTEDQSLLGSACLLHDYVGQRCRPYSYSNSNLEDWLVAELGREWFSHLSQETYRMCRLAWIDRMIHQLETTGELP
jgi:hypothetical protein